MRRATIVCVAFGLLAAAVGATSASARPVQGAPCTTPSNYGNEATPAVAPASRGVLYSRYSWSRDGGRTWTQSPLCGGSIYGFSRAQPHLVYRIESGDVTRSTDGGLSWSARGSVGPHEEYALVVDQRDPDTLCAQFSDRSSSPQGPLLSVDGGLHWAPTSDCGTVARLARGGQLVRVEPGQPVLDVSSDGGATWVSKPTDVTVAGSLLITSDPTRPRSLYGRSEMDPAWTYHSVDGGTHWTPVSIPSEVDSSTIAAVFLDPVRRGTIVEYQHGELWVSRNTGASWKRSSAHLATAPTGFDAAGVLYQVVGTHPRVSRDDGRTWIRR